ncbi:cobalamin-dependent protein, partial [Thermoproteota archaeon]
MNVLFLHPPMYPKSKNYGIIPMGIIGLMNLLKEDGHSVLGINVPLEVSINSGFDLVRDMKTCDFDIILIDLHWYVHSYGSLWVASVCKKINPNCFVCLGGFTASFFDMEILSNYPFIDFIIRGEAEIALPLLLNKLGKFKKDFKNIPNLTFRKNGKIQQNSIKCEITEDQFNSLNFVDVGWLRNFDKYFSTDSKGYNFLLSPYFYLEVGRGCPYSCSICGGTTESYNKICARRLPIYRSPRRIAQDISFLREKGIKCVAFSHDLFTTKSQVFISLTKS